VYTDRIGNVAERLLGLTDERYILDDIMVICVGTPKFNGDALGPLVGSILQKERPGITVRGTLSTPITACNIGYWANVSIPKHYKDKFIIGIDAGIANNPNNVNTMRVLDGPLLPGLGVNKDLPALGDIAVVGYTCHVIETCRFLALEEVPKKSIQGLATKIVDSLLLYFELLEIRSLYSNQVVGCGIQ
jgi:putative sporulation protein YyaC